jgi:hypothetical protein
LRDKTTKSDTEGLRDLSGREFLLFALVPAFRYSLKLLARAICIGCPPQLPSMNDKINLGA